MPADKTNKKIKTWYSSRYQSVLVQRNILLFFAIVSMFAVSIAVVFVKKVLSSKTLEPYVIELDKNTGIANLVTQPTNNNPGIPITAQGNEFSSIEKYFINDFIQSALGFDATSYPQKKEKVRLFSVPSINSDFLSRIDPEKSKDGSIQVRIKSIKKVDSSKALITVERLFDNIANNPDGRRMEDITIQFNFFPEDMNFTAEERLINPLGFQVSSLEIKEKLYDE